jgi:hypothetical protein
LLKSSAGVLPGESNSAGLRKEKDRGEEGFKIFAGFAGAFDDILSISGITFSVLFTEKDFNFTILSNSSLRMF